MTHLPGKFVWFEHVSSDTAKARAFYEPLFRWHIERVPMGDRTYDMIMNGADGIGGLRTATAGTPNHWMSYLSVADVDRSFAAAIAAGAKEVMPPTDHGPVGRGATIVDPTGTTVSLWTSAQDDRADADPTPDGDWYWNELWTHDAKQALAFYEKVFGYTHDTMDMGPQGPYHLLKSADGKMRGGIMQPSEPSAPTLWVPYVHVADVDATAAKAQQLGALMTVVPPKDIPVGRLSILIDPFGAAFAVMKRNPA